MNASIKSCDEFKGDSRGKTHRVYADKFEVRCYAGKLHVKAIDKESYNPQSDFSITPPRDMYRTLELTLSPDDLEQLVDAALAANLLRLTVAASIIKKK